MKAKVLFFPLLILMGSWALSCASTNKNWYHGKASGKAFGVDLVVGGAVLPVFEHRGSSHVEGRLGESYVVRVHNWSTGRIEAVVSVDGRDVIDGLPADPDKRGYLIEPHSFVDIQGWRTSLNDVASFRFTSPDDAYSTRMGTPQLAGKVEVAIFEEKPRPSRQHPLRTAEEDQGRGDRGWDQSQEAQKLSRQARPRSRNLGTQFGQRRSSAVSEARFERRSLRPAAWLGLGYDDRQGLCHRGLASFCRPYPPYQQRPIETRPVGDRFAEPPPGWDHFSPWY